MLTQTGTAEKMESGGACECTIVGRKGKGEEGLFLVGLGREMGGREKMGKKDGKVRSRARKSLKVQRGDKENMLTNDTSMHFKQTNTCFSSNYFLEQPLKASYTPFLINTHAQRPPLTSLVPHHPNHTATLGVTSIHPAFEYKNLQTTEVPSAFNRKPTEFRFFSTHAQKGPQIAVGSKLRENPKLDRAQSSDNLIVPKLALPASKGKAEWRSQFVDVGQQGSASKRTHRLTDLQVKCTESIHDSESPQISQIVSISESDTSRSQSNLTETIPRRMRDLLHMKYSKVEGRRH